MFFGLVHLSPTNTVSPASPVTHPEKLKAEAMALAAIAALPSSPWRPTTEREQDAECEICLEPMQVGQAVCRMPRCAHAFHHACLQRWLIEGQQFKKRRCPVCRTDLFEPTPEEVEMTARPSASSSAPSSPVMPQQVDA